MIVKRLMARKIKSVAFPILLCSLVVVIINYKLSSLKPAPRKSVLNLQRTDPNYNVHIFYDGGYRNTLNDDGYMQWNYNFFKLEYVINVTYYPVIGLYSSTDRTVIDLHMQQIRNSNIGVVVIKWWPKIYNNAPDLSLLFDYVYMYDLRATIEIQDYYNRNISNFRENLETFFKKYRRHPALYWASYKSQRLPLIYIYKPHLISEIDWSQMLGISENSLRSTTYDAFFIGHIEEDENKNFVVNAKFNGFYTRDPFIHNSSGIKWSSWPYLEDFARKQDLIFIPTVTPGSKFVNSDKYDKRSGGNYYTTSWMRAVVCRARMVSINSFNGWTDSTQIEPAKPYKIDYKGVALTYASYLPNEPDYYLYLTSAWIFKFTNTSAYRNFPR